jgi:hypothetical protein
LQHPQDAYTGLYWGSAAQRIPALKAIHRLVSRLESFEMCWSLLLS